MKQVIFVHIPKTVGTTMGFVLARPKMVTPDMLALIEQHAQTDIALHAFAKTYFSEQVECQAPEIHDDLVPFRREMRFTRDANAWPNPCLMPDGSLSRCPPFADAPR